MGPTSCSHSHSITSSSSRQINQEVVMAPPEVEVSHPTVLLLQQTCDRLKNVTMEDALRVWHYVGQTIATQLTNGKGVRLEKLASQKPSSATLSTSVSNTSLNYAQVAAAAEMERNVVEKVIKAITETLYQVLQNQASISLALHPVAELICAGQNATMTCTTEFLDDWEARRQKKALDAIKPQVMKEGRTTERMRMVTKALGAMRTHEPAATPGASQPRHYHGSTPRSSTVSGLSTSRTLTTPRSMCSEASSASLARLIASSPGGAKGRSSAGGAGAGGRSMASSTGSRQHSSSSKGHHHHHRQQQQQQPVTLVDQLRRKIIERGGGAGIKGLASVLRLMDEDGDKKINKTELKYGLRNFGLTVSEKGLDDLMNYFDRDRDGSIDSDEFLRGIRGNMNERRQAMVNMAFDTLDRTGDGVVTVEDLMDVYDLSWHPEVKNGSKSRDQALREFLSQWDRREKDGIVTREEFMDYYQDVSASVDSDVYFELMIRNAWRISGGGQAANSANLRVLVTHADGRQTVETVQKELGLKRGGVKGTDAIMERLRAQGANPVALDIVGKAEKDNVSVNAADNTPASATVWAARLKKREGQLAKRKYAQQEAKKKAVASSKAQESGLDLIGRLFYTPPKTLEEFIQTIRASLIDEDPRVSVKALATHIQHLEPSINRVQLQAALNELDPKRTKYVAVKDLHRQVGERFGRDKKTAKPVGVIERVQAKIRQRAGQASIKSLARTLSLFDENGDGQISKEELKYGLQDYGISLNFREVDDLMSYFDRDKSGKISFEEFLRGMRGAMNERRQAMVNMAFDTLDRTGDGLVTIDDLVDVYDLSWHPAVKTGSMSKGQALKDFLSLWDRREKDGIVSREEFMDYYEDVSASVDSDVYFELMIRNAWRISGGEGQAANSANLRVLVTHADGRQTVEEVKKPLGLKGNIVKGIKDRLRSQGVNAIDIEVRGEMEKDGSNKGKVGAASLPPERGLAATRLQAIFRSHQAQRVAENERRKAVRTEQEKKEQAAFVAEGTNKVKRPQLRSFYGF